MTSNPKLTWCCVYDVTSPTPTVSGSSLLVQSVSQDIDITFDESVVDLVLGDLTVTGASADSLSGSGSTYALTVTPTAAGVDVTVGVPAFVCDDLAAIRDQHTPDPV